MQNPDELFLTTKQEAKKLTIALNRLFGGEPLPDVLTERYQSYIRRRIRPAVLLAVKENKPRLLSALLRTGWGTSALLSEAADLAASLGRTELTALIVRGNCSRPDPADSSRVQNLTPDALADEIFRVEKLRICSRFPFLGLAVSDLRPKAVPGRKPATDGEFLFFDPGQLTALYLDGRLSRFLLHLTMHCLYLHIFPPKNCRRRLWDTACDLAVWWLLDRLPREPSEEKEEQERCRKLYAPIFSRTSAVSAENLYQLFLKEPALVPREKPGCDDHDPWYEGQISRSRVREGPCEDSAVLPFGMENGSHSDGAGGFDISDHEEEEKRLLRMEQILKKWQHFAASSPAVRTASRSRGALPGSRVEKIILRQKNRYDFRRYLRRFSVKKEEMGQDPGSFDYIPYCYGLQRYGNLPLIEPLETRETAKVEELVIAIDTSGSCSEETVRRFLEECQGILLDPDSFFPRMNVHLIQCDSMIQQHTVITCAKDWKRCSQNLTVSGRGGTDFTPVFTYVDKLCREGRLKHLGGLLYFTDGDGIYPSKQPAYETAFVFTDYRFLEYKIPPWIIRLCLDLGKEGNEVWNYEH